MPRDITQSDVPPGKLTDCLLKCIAALKADSTLAELVGRDNIVDGHSDGDPADIAGTLLAVEAVSGGSEQSGVIEEQRITVQVTPFLSQSLYEDYDNTWLAAVRDRAVNVLKAGIGPGFIYRGATDDFSFDEPQTADDADALMMHTGRVQFRVNIAPDDGVSG